MMTGSFFWLLALGVLFFFIIRKGGGCCGDEDHKCKGNDRNKDRGPEKNESGNHLRQHLQNGETFRDENSAAPANSFQDPVCGMTVESGTISTSSEYRGQTFSFCSEQCRKLFDLNPARYVKIDAVT